MDRQENDKFLYTQGGSVKRVNANNGLAKS